jgi:putative glutathione S-transferase
MDTKWAFGDDVAGSTGAFSLFPDAVFLADVYAKAPPPGWDNVNSVPFLLDKQTKTGVSNGSADICKFFLTKLRKPAAAAHIEFGTPAAPEQAAVDDLVKQLGVLGGNATKAQKAEDQKSYDEATDNIDKALAAADDILAKNKFLLGENITLVDLLLWSFYLGWDSHYQVVSNYIKPLAQFYPNVARYVAEVARAIPGNNLRSVYSQLQIDANRGGSATLIRKLPEISYLAKL